MRWALGSARAGVLIRSQIAATAGCSNAMARRRALRIMLAASEKRFSWISGAFDPPPEGGDLGAEPTAEFGNGAGYLHNAGRPQ